MQTQYCISVGPETCNIACQYISGYGYSAVGGDLVYISVDHGEVRAEAMEQGVQGLLHEVRLSVVASLRAARDRETCLVILNRSCDLIFLPLIDVRGCGILKQYGEATTNM